jgi:hypothetical protein
MGFENLAGTHETRRHAEARADFHDHMRIGMIRVVRREHHRVAFRAKLAHLFETRGLDAGDAVLAPEVDVSVHPKPRGTDPAPIDRRPEGVGKIVRRRRISHASNTKPARRGIQNLSQR